MNWKQVGAGVLVACLAGLAASSPAAAGCCLVIGLEELPEQLQVGEPTEFAINVTVNGEHPISNREVTLQFEHMTSGQAVSLEAVEALDPGRYLAEFTPHVAGEWAWSIEVGGGNYGAMPTLTAVAAGAAGSASARGGPDMRTSLRWAGGALLLAAAGLTVIRRRQPALTHPGAAG